MSGQSGIFRSGCYCIGIKLTVVTLADAPQKGRSPEAASIDWTIWNISENWNCGIT